MIKCEIVITSTGTSFYRYVHQDGCTGIERELADRLEKFVDELRPTGAVDLQQTKVDIDLPKELFRP